MKSVPLLALLLFAPPATAGALPDAPVVAESAGAREELLLQRLEARQQRLSAELEALARSIEERKTRARGRVLPDGELEALLRRSQQLATELAALHREAEARRERLRRILRRELGQVETALAAARLEGDEAQVRRLDERRGTLRHRLDSMQPARAAARVDLPAGAADDPDEVREQVDLLRDQRDRVLAQLRLVERRLEQAREEELLTRELRDFVEEGDLFDDGGRLMRAGKTVARTLPGEAGGAAGGDAPAGGAPGGDAAADAPAGDAGAEAGAPQRGGSDPLGPSEGDLDGGAAPAPTPPPVDPVRQAPAAGSMRIVGSRPLGADLELGRIPALDGSESAAELLEQQRALQELARALEAKAARWEERAKRLAGPHRR